MPISMICLTKSSLASNFSGVEWWLHLVATGLMAAVPLLLLTDAVAVGLIFVAILLDFGFIWVGWFLAVGFMAADAVGILAVGQIAADVVPVSHCH